MDFFQSIIDFIAENPRLIIGNAIGIVTTVLMFLALQTRTPRMMMMYQCTLSFTSIVSFAVLGAWSGMALQTVCLIRNFIFFYHDKKIFSYKWWPYALAVLAGGAGMLSWQGPISLLIIVAIMANTIFISLNDNRIFRLSVLVTSSMIIVYDVYFMAYFSSITEVVAIISAIIGLNKFKKQNKD